MNWSKGKIIGAVLVVAALTIGTVVVVGNARKKKLYKAIDDQLNGDSGSSASQSAIQNIFSTTWWKNVAEEAGGSFFPLTPGAPAINLTSTLQKGADALNGWFPSVTHWTTDDDSIVGYITSLGSWAKISYVSYLFTKSGYGDLYSLLAAHLNSAKWSKLQQTVLGFKKI